MSNCVKTLNEAKLARYLEAQIEGFKGPLTAEKFAGGQSNPTFLLTTEKRQYVLRRKPPGQLLASAHAVDREFKVIEALAYTDVPVPRSYHLCNDDRVIGSMFYVMSFEQGPIYWDPALLELDKEARSAIHSEIIRVLATLHDVDIYAVGLGDYGKSGNYFERQIGRWSKQFRAAETETIASMDALIEWLPANIPTDDGQVSLIHGDFRIDNIIFTPKSTRALAVLDWELSTLGHPLADLAYYCMCLRLPREAGNVKGLAGLDRSKLGIPTEDQIIAQYCEQRGLDGLLNWNFYLAFSFFRLASICQGVMKRALSGNASNDDALAAGKLAGPLAEMGAMLIDN